MKSMNTNKYKVTEITDAKLKTLIRTHDETKWKENMCNKSSLIHYRKFKTNLKRPEKYLHSITDFKGAQLKFKARSYTLGLAYEKRKWGDNTDTTCLCCKEEEETLEHFMFKCSFLDTQRNTMMGGVREILLSKRETNLLREIQKDEELMLILFRRHARAIRFKPV